MSQSVSVTSFSPTWNWLHPVLGPNFEPVRLFQPEINWVGPRDVCSQITSEEKALFDLWYEL